MAYNVSSVTKRTPLTQSVEEFFVRIQAAIRACDEVQLTRKLVAEVESGSAAGMRPGRMRQLLHASEWHLRSWCIGHERSAAARPLSRWLERVGGAERRHHEFGVL